MRTNVIVTFIISARYTWVWIGDCHEIGRVTRALETLMVTTIQCTTKLVNFHTLQIIVSIKYVKKSKQWIKTIQPIPNTHQFNPINLNKARKARIVKRVAPPSSLRPTTLRAKSSRAGSLCYIYLYVFVQMRASCAFRGSHALTPARRAKFSHSVTSFQSKLLHTSPSDSQRAAPPTIFTFVAAGALVIAGRYAFANFFKFFFQIVIFSYSNWN